MKKYFCCYALSNSSHLKWPDKIVTRFTKNIFKEGLICFEIGSEDQEEFLCYISDDKLKVFKFETWYAVGKDTLCFDNYYLNVKDNIRLYHAKGINRSLACNYENVCDNGTVQTGDLELEAKHIKNFDIQKACIGLPNLLIISGKFKDILTGACVTGCKYRGLKNISPDYYQLEIYEEVKKPINIVGGKLTICEKCGVVKFYSSSEKQVIEKNSLCGADFQISRNITWNNNIYESIEYHTIISNKILRLSVENKLTGFLKASPSLNMMYMPVILE